MKLGEVRTLRYRKGPLPADARVAVLEIRKMKGTRRKNAFGEWETFGKGTRVRVEWQDGVYWLDEEDLE